jgi:hypothetical protein
MKVAARLLRLAKSVVKTEMSFLRSPKAENSGMNSIHYEVSRFMDTVRKNEGLETYVNREDDNDRMTLEVGISEHESADAIVDAIVELAEKVARKNDIEMKN